MAIAAGMESKTLPEIIDVFLRPVIVSKGYGGCEATIVTNISSFTGIATYPYPKGIPGSETIEFFKDYSTIEERLKNIMKSLDPRKLDEVDEVLKTALGDDVNPTIQLAIGYACCRAGARHKAVPLYRYIADFSDSSSSMCIPMPIISVLGVAAGEPDSPNTQDITITPTSALSFKDAFESSMQLSYNIQTKLLSTRVQQITSENGCPRTTMESFDECAKFVKEVLNDSDIPCDIKLGMDLRGDSFVFEGDDGNFQSRYIFKGKDAASQNGFEVAQAISNCYREAELISVEDPLSGLDIDSLKALKNKVNSTIADIKKEMSEDLEYNIKGVGGDSNCVIQIVADNICKSAEDVEHLDGNRIYNAVKVRMDKIGSVTDAIKLVKTAKNLGWSIVVGTNEESPESMDTFISDFAVGIGATQLMAGGLYSGEHICKYNRLCEIARENEEIQFVSKKFRK